MTTTTGKHHAATVAPAATGVGHAVRAFLLHAAGVLFALVLLPVCLAMGVPFTAWAIAAGLVAANSVVHGIVAWAVRDASLTVALGALGFSTIFRALLTALALFFVGAAVGASGDQSIGLDRPDLARSAIIIFLLCFTLDAGIDVIRRAAQREELGAADPAPTSNVETSA
ncbi:MAG: hypothetical protein JWM86_75 [Thermoleophilia bacterium]|nr:hypothetical protein [Thermoleophilia bacterium]